MRTQGAMRFAGLMMVLMAGCGSKGPAATGPGTETAAETGTETETATETETETETETATETEAETEAETDTVADNVPANSAAAAYLRAHNQYRKAHCAPPLRWSEQLAKAAQTWAATLRKKDCAFEHSRTRYGENLAGGTSGALDPAGATAMWYREVDAYDFQRGGFSMETGHFTQLVWAGTTEIGCGMTTCKGLDIFVCNYNPPGNVERGYRANVKPTSCK